jgi:GGDEF domain-containing protein
MYKVFARLGDGEFLLVGPSDELEQAVQLAEKLNGRWPRESVVRDSRGNDVDFGRPVPMEPERGTVSPTRSPSSIGQLCALCNPVDASRE